MGISLNRMLGYALTDLKTENGKIVDPRVNPDSPLLDWTKSPKVKDYAEWLADHKVDEDYFSLDYACLVGGWSNDEEKAKLGDESMSQFVTFRSEYGLTNVLLVQLVMSNGWSRYRDLLDSYIEETNEYELRDRVDHLRGGIYPFIGKYVNRKNGEEIKDHLALNWLRRFNAYKAKRATSGLSKLEKSRFKAELDCLAQEAGLDGHKDAKRNIRAKAPIEVQQVIEFGELFTSKSAILDLKPVLYSFYS